MMAVGAGNKRFNITLPEKLYEDLQQVAESSKRTISEIIIEALQQSWRSPEQLQEEVRHLLIKLSDMSAREFAEVDKALATITQLLERQHLGAAPAPQTIEAPVPITTPEQLQAIYEQTEREQAAAAALIASQQAVNIPEPRRPWWHRLLFLSS
jgi:hypothetical protein